MQTPENDTISAIITPPGPGGIAVIRISGPEAISIADGLFKGVAPLANAAAQTVHFGIIIGADGRELDEVLATVFRAPHSYTTEDVVELSCHGSPYIARLLLGLVVDRGARLAGPGEFTRRAFLNGRIDLAQAEAVADLIEADSRASHELAIAQLRGTLSSKIEALRSRILDLCSMLELELDFSEEGLEFVNRVELRQRLGGLREEITQVLESFELGNIYSYGVRAVLAGSPNVGKSSILNALVQADRAIVTEISGTTRDTLEEMISLAGLSFTLVDTAGLRATEDPIEAEGIRRARQQIGAASLIIVIIDPTQGIDDQYRQALECAKPLAGGDREFVVVINKVDLVDPAEIERVKKRFEPWKTVLTSAAKGIGLKELEQAMTATYLESRARSRGESLTIYNLRHRAALHEAAASLALAMEGLGDGRSPELLAVDLRAALSHLSQVTGIDISEEILNNIFDRFCIGK